MLYFSLLNNTQNSKFNNSKTSSTGWLTKRRPINTTEISGVYLNIQKSTLKMVLELGFSQINCSKEVRDYMRKRMARTASNCS